MTTLSESATGAHTVRAFDDELQQLHSLLLTMTELLMRQLEQAMRALDAGDMDLAEKVLARASKVKHCEARIDNEVLALIARRCPVANDLRTAISSSKIVVELAKIGEELADFTRLITVLYDPDTSDPNPKLLADIIKIGDLIKLMLNKLIQALEQSDTEPAYALLRYDRDCENELQEGIRHQLALVLKDVRMTRRALDVMQMMKALERCGEHSRNIAQYLIFMLDGIDVRHARG